MPLTRLSVSPSLTMFTPEEDKTPKMTSMSENSQTLDSCVLLSAELSSCGLTQYLDVLVRNGFVDWNTVLDIQEGDLDAMDFKLGHRRKLQRHISNYFSHTASPQSLPLFSDNNDAKEYADKTVSKWMEETYTPARFEKRSYRRRPKPDMNAPTKPKTGYVLYSNHMRANPEVAVMPFDAIAKHIGHNWQLLGLNGRKKWQDRPTNDMLAYYASLRTYKQSKDYAVYQTYLTIFKKEEKHQSLMQEKKLFERRNEATSLDNVWHSFLAIVFD
jgi:hypothetical protein